MGLLSKIIAISIFYITSVAFSSSCQADDSSLGVPLPGFYTSGLRAVVYATVTLRGDQVDETLTVFSEGQQDAELQIQMPRFDWLGEAEIYPDRQFPELSVKLNDRPAAVASRFTAFLGASEITAIVEEAGVDPFVIAESPPIVGSVQGHEDAFQRLVAIGAVVPSEAGYLAKWSAQRSITVKLLRTTAPATLSLLYQARPSFERVSAESISDSVGNDRFCLDAAQLKSRIGSMGLHSVVRREYTLPIGLNGTKVNAVRVNIAANAEVAKEKWIVAFCGPLVDVMTSVASPSATARTDADGMLHILVLEP